MVVIVFDDSLLTFMIILGDTEPLFDEEPLQLAEGVFDIHGNQLIDDESWCFLRSGDLWIVLFNAQ